MTVRATAPGRVNLIGDHTDYTGGLVLPIAVDRVTTVEGEPGGAVVHLASADEPGPATVPLDVTEPARAEPSWARYVAGVVRELAPTEGFRGSVGTTIPIGAGLASSAALEVALALALGFDGSPVELARLCQRAEQEASGVPCGIMDQLISAAALEGHALLIDCTTLEHTPVAIPDDAAVWVIDSGEPRRLAASPYAERRAQAEAAGDQLGPLRHSTPAQVEALDDPLLRRRARHVVSENARVVACADALAAGELRTVGQLMVESHASLRDDFEVSTAALDALVETLTGMPEVFGARLTGGGFGGCVVALAGPTAQLEGWRVRAHSGARVTRRSQ